MFLNFYISNQKNQSRLKSKQGEGKDIITNQEKKEDSNYQYKE